MKFTFLKKIFNQRRIKSNMQQGVMAVDIHNTIGIGARLEWVLEILAFCEEKNVSPRFRFTYPGSKEDYFSRFFKIDEKYCTDAGSLPFVQIFTIAELGLEKDYDKLLTITKASQLIQKYLVIKPDIVKEVETFCCEHFLSKKILGVHYRGTDKFTEAGDVSYKKVEENIAFYIQKNPEIDAVFLSTDDENFLNNFQNNASDIQVFSRNDSYRSADNKPIHFSEQNKYDINRDALVNCLLLSRCDGLIKSASILSAWSVLFNPKIPLVMLNKPFDNYFPERELQKTVQYEPI